METPAQATRTTRMAMPLLNTPYKLGACKESINQITDPDSRNIALAEYYYFSGQSEKASALVEPYLNHPDLTLQLSACWLYGYANLALNRTENSHKVLSRIQAAKKVTASASPALQALVIGISTSAAVLLHLPLPKILHELKDIIRLLPPGLRLFVLYIQAHHAYLNNQYGVCIGIAETALALEEKLYPIPTIYLHLVATMGYTNLKHMPEAKAHLMEAWSLARPDDMIEAFGEHHGLLGGMLEAVIKKDFPDDFAKMIAITYDFSAGWRELHKEITGNSIANELTTTEFTVAMLAARGWSNKEIAAHLGSSVNTVKHQISSVLLKLGVTQRKELAKFMLK